MPFSVTVTSKTNLNCQPAEFKLVSAFPPGLSPGLGASDLPPASCQPAQPMAGTDSICAVPIRHWNGWRIESCPTEGPPSQPAVVRVLCQYRAPWQPERFKLAWPHRNWHHREIGTPDPAVYIIQLSHILGRDQAVHCQVCCFSVPAGNFGSIYLLLLATCIFRFIHADTGIYMHIHAIHADTCKILHVCIWYVWVAICVCILLQVHTHTYT